MDDMSTSPLIREVHSIQAPNQAPSREKKKKSKREPNSDDVAPNNPSQDEMLDDIIPSQEEEGKGGNVDIQV